MADHSADRQEGEGHRVDHDDRAIDADRDRGQAAAEAVPTRKDNGARRPAAQPEATGRLPSDPLESVLKQLERSQWALLKELRNGRKFRETHPQKLPSLGDSLGFCEQCGAWYGDLEDLVHHQFIKHPEIFVEPGELMLETPSCCCLECDRDGWRDFLDELG
jgi:hypothetical protein